MKFSLLAQKHEFSPSRRKIICRFSFADVHMRFVTRVYEDANYRD